MLPSKGYFKALSCPFHHEGLCKRSYCHFRHSRKDGQSLTELPIFTNGTSKPSLSADSNTVTDQADTHFEKSATGGDNGEQPCSENVMPSRSAELMLEKPSTTAPSYKPTPISELQKRHIPVTFNPDSERIRSKTHIRKKAKIEYVPKSIGGKVHVADYKPTPSNSSIESKFLNAVKSTPSSPSSQEFTLSQVKKMDLIIKNPNLMPSIIPSSSTSSLNSSFESSDELTTSQELNMDLIVKNPHMTPKALGITSKDDVLDDYIAKEIDLLGEILAADGVGSVFESLEADYNAKYEQSDNSSEVSRVDDDGADDNITDDDDEIMPADVQNSDLDDDSDQEERIPGPIKTDSLESDCNFTKTVQESEKSRTKSDGKNDNSSKSKSTTTTEDNKHSKSSKHGDSSKHRSDKHSDSQQKGLTNSDQKKQNGSEIKVGDKQTESSHQSKHKSSSSKSSDKSHSSSSKHRSSSSSKSSDRSHKSHGSSNKHGSTSSKSSDRSHSLSNKHGNGSSSHKDEKSHKHSRKDEGIKDEKCDKNLKKDESSKDDKSVKHSKKDGSSKDDRSVKHLKKDEPCKHEKSSKLSKKDESGKEDKPDKCSKKDGPSKENKSDKHSKKDDSSKSEKYDKDSKKYKSSRDDKTDRHSHDRKDESKTSRKSSHSKDKNSEKSSRSDSKKDDSHKKDSRDGKSRKHSHSDTLSDSNSKDCKKSRTDKYNSNNNENVIENREKDSHRKRKHSPEKNHHSSSRNSKKSKHHEKYHHHDKSLPKSHEQIDDDDLYHSDHSSDVEEIVQPVVTISIDSSSDESAEGSPQSSVKSSPAHQMDHSDSENEPPLAEPETTIEPHLEIPTVKTKVRTAHNFKNRTIRASSSLSKPNARKSMTPSEILLKRYSGTSASGASTSSPTSSQASSADIPAHPGGQRVRIAHVPNVNSLLDSRRQLLKGVPAQNANNLPRTSGVPREAIACSGPPSVLQKEPLPIVANIPNCSIPLVKRQNFLSSIYDSYCQIYDFKTAREKALKAEQEIAKNSSKTTYRDKVANLCIGLKRDAALLSGRISIENSSTNEEDPLIPAYTYGKPLYDCFLKYIVADPYEEGIPVEHPTEPGCARMKLLYNESSRSFNKPYNICLNCGKKFSVDENNFSVERNCRYHRDRRQKMKSIGSRYHDRYWACCGQNKPCVVSEYHIRDNIDYDMMPGFVKTPPCPAGLKFPGIYALDCEMCYTTHDHELTRVTVVNHEREVVYESYCKPLFPIIDYCTRFSGVEEKHLINVTTTLNEIQEDLMKIFNEKTILVGHSIGSDLKALKIIHKNIVDTSCIFVRQNGFRQKLRDIAQEFLKRPIQEGVNGHCSEEDAMASLDLMIYKIKEDCKVCKPRTIISLG